MTAPGRKPFERYGPTVDELWRQAVSESGHRPPSEYLVDAEWIRRRYRELLAQHGLLRRTGPGHETAARGGTVSIYLGAT